MWIGRYLAATKDRGIIKPDMKHSFDCYVDANFCGRWNQESTLEDPSMAKSIIMYARCPVMWSSKMQTEVTLSTTEAEYMVLLTALMKRLNRFTYVVKGPLH